MRTVRGIQRLHIKLTIHCSYRNKQQVTAQVNTGAERTLIHGHPQEVSAPLSTIDGYGGQPVTVPLALQIGVLSHENEVFISPILEYILDIEILQGQTLQTSFGEFRLQVRIIRSVLRGNTEEWLLPNDINYLGV